MSISSSWIIKLIKYGMLRIIRKSHIRWARSFVHQCPWEPPWRQRWGRWYHDVSLLSLYPWWFPWKNWVHVRFVLVKSEPVYQDTYGRNLWVCILCQKGVTFSWTLELYLRHFWTDHIKTEMFPISEIVSRVKICHC